MVGCFGYNFDERHNGSRRSVHSPSNRLSSKVLRMLVFYIAHRPKKIKTERKCFAHSVRPVVDVFTIGVRVYIGGTGKTFQARL